MIFVVIMIKLKDILMENDELDILVPRRSKKEREKNQIGRAHV